MFSLGGHNLTEEEFEYYDIAHGVVDHLRGVFAASMEEKRAFAASVLDHLKSHAYIASWEEAGSNNRYDYDVHLNSGRRAAIELKGGMDGNNVTIFERPHDADEFIIWSVFPSPAGDPRKNAWSGINRLSAEIIAETKPVDGLVIWDWICGSAARPCPKITIGGVVPSTVGKHILPPPCIYSFPREVAFAGDAFEAQAQNINQTEILQAFHNCFNGSDPDLNSVNISVFQRGNELFRQPSVTRNGFVVKKPRPSKIKRKGARGLAKKHGKAVT